MKKQAKKAEQEPVVVRLYEDGKYKQVIFHLPRHMMVRNDSEYIMFAVPVLRGQSLLGKGIEVTRWLKSVGCGATLCATDVDNDDSVEDILNNE